MIIGDDMKCPVCKDPALVISERQGIEIDYCPSCRGIWLDRGELDKLIEKSTASEFQLQRRMDHSEPRQHSHGYSKKPKSWLHEIFD
ncbi:MAG: hypothetical protein RLZZ166_669 [Pseudomonadota bacterium]